MGAAPWLDTVRHPRRPCLRHPRLKRGVSPNAFYREFAALANRAGRRGFVFAYKIFLSNRMHAKHCANARSFAQVDIRYRIFEFAPEVLFLARKFRLGLIAHEIGHVIAGSKGSEADADSAAAAYLGVRIGYDMRFPGKGLQVARSR